MNYKTTYQVGDFIIVIGLEDSVFQIQEVLLDDKNHSYSAIALGGIYAGETDLAGLGPVVLYMYDIERKATAEEALVFEVVSK